MKPKIVLLEFTSQCESLMTQIMQCGYQACACPEAADLVSYLSSDAYEVLVVNVALPYPGLLKQISQVLLKNPLPVVMFARSSDNALTELAIRSGVSALEISGFDAHRLRHALDVAKARFAENERLKSELHKLKIQLADRNSIDKAKLILMKRRAIDETTAACLIRKMALDRKQNLAQVARNIIDVDELLI